VEQEERHRESKTAWPYDVLDGAKQKELGANYI